VSTGSLALLVELGHARHGGVSRVPRHPMHCTHSSAQEEGGCPEVSGKRGEEAALSGAIWYEV